MPVATVPNLTRTGEIHLTYPDDTPAGHFVLAISAAGDWSLAPAEEVYTYPTRDRTVAAVRRAFTAGTRYRSMAAFRVPDRESLPARAGEVLCAVPPR